MKKISLPVILIILALLLTACGNVSADSEQTTDSLKAELENSENETTGLTEAKEFSLTIPENGEPVPIIDWMKNGAFSFDFDAIITAGENVDYKSGSLSVVDENAKIVFFEEYEGKTNNLTYIKKDLAVYLYVDSGKSIHPMICFDIISTGGIATDYRKIEFSSSGTGEIAGKTLPYDEYQYSEYGGPIKFFYYDGRVVGIEYDLSYKVVMIITNPSNKVPANAFDFPKGYSMQEMVGADIYEGLMQQREEEYYD